MMLLIVFHRILLGQNCPLIGSAIHITEGSFLMLLHVNINLWMSARIQMSISMSPLLIL